MSTDENSAPPGDRAPGRMDAEVWRVVTVVILGSIMAVLDTTIVNVALQSTVPRSSCVAEQRPVGGERLPAVAGRGDPL